MQGLPLLSSDHIESERMEYWLHLYHHHHCLWPLLEHRPSTRALQASQSWASLSSCPQVQPILFVSASRLWCQVFLWRSCFFFPCGFQVGAWHVIQVIHFRRVCPIPLQHLWRISFSAGCCLVHFQCSLLLMVPGHGIRRLHPFATPVMIRTRLQPRHRRGQLAFVLELCNTLLATWTTLHVWKWTVRIQGHAKDIISWISILFSQGKCLPQFTDRRRGAVSQCWWCAEYASGERERERNCFQVVSRYSDLRRWFISTPGFSCWSKLQRLCIKCDSAWYSHSLVFIICCIIFDSV